MPKLSIITINYNNLIGVIKTIESVVNQTWNEFEYIIIDGGSTDGSAKYIKENSHQFKYWISEPDKGIYNAMNKGIKVSNGEYLLFLNSGDYFLNDDVLRQNIKYLYDYDLFCFNLLMKRENNTSRIMNTPEILRFSDLYFRTLPHPSTFIKRELFNTVGFYDDNLKIVSDWKFFILALFKHHCSYIKVNNTLSVFHTGGVSSSQNIGKTEKLIVLKEHFSSFIEDYTELNTYHKNISNNRFRMLLEIEKNFFGKKAVSLVFRLFILIFSKKKLKSIAIKEIKYWK
jgi:glycosyltransferase involved in cell wall biosynthesis